VETYSAKDSVVHAYNTLLQVRLLSMHFIHNSVSLDISVGMTTTLWVGRPKNRGSTTSTDISLLAYRPALGPTHSLAVETATQLYLVPRYRMNGLIPPLLHTSSWRGEGLYFLIHHSLQPPPKSGRYFNQFYVLFPVPILLR
jgi:hypothetical protein